MQRHGILGYCVLGRPLCGDRRAAERAGCAATHWRAFCLYGCVLDLFRLYVRRVPTVVVDTEDYTEQAIAAGSIDDMTGWRAYKLGAVTNLSNPKALVFFGAVFAQFIRPDMSPTWTVAVAVILLAMSLTWFSTFALIVRAASRWIAHHSAAIDIVSGLIFAVLGLVMAVEGIIELFG